MSCRIEFSRLAQRRAASGVGPWAIALVQCDQAQGQVMKAVNTMRGKKFLQCLSIGPAALLPGLPRAMHGSRRQDIDCRPAPRKSRLPDGRHTSLVRIAKTIHHERHAMNTQLFESLPPTWADVGRAVADRADAETSMGVEQKGIPKILD